jgi:two-component system, chemotaxis family, protein-glutamate methylesterase/glutaminase
MSSVRVLVVDDSAFARKVMREVLSSAPDIEVVGVAHDGLDALEKIDRLDPDVVALDLLMPNLDGVGVLHALAGRARPRCVVVSTSDEQSALAAEALQAGAVDLVHKPTALATDRLYELSTELVEKIRVAAKARTRSDQPPSSVPLPTMWIAGTSGVELVVIGASTGGPQALTYLLGALPANLPVPVAVVLHMPVGYTQALSQRLDNSSAIDVVEAYDGLALRRAAAIIARGGVHMRIAGARGALRVALDPAPADSLHRPSVDVLFESAARASGPRVLGIVLTGMGDDGTAGARAIRQAGGAVMTQDEPSCVVYGMPRAVVEAGLSQASVPLEGMATAILRAL